MKKNKRYILIGVILLLVILSNKIVGTIFAINNSISQILATNKIFNYKSLKIERLSRLNFLNKTNLLLGKREMRKRKVLFVGIARDNASQLPEVMRHIEYIGGFFADYGVIIFENDSSDATKFILNLWCMINPKIVVKSQDYYFRKRPSIKFMAEARNKYLDILKDKEYDDFDIVIALDMDMIYGIDVRGIADSFSKINRWDVVCSNGIYTPYGYMWDFFALRDEKLTLRPAEYKAKYPNQDFFKDEMMPKAIIVKYKPNSDLVAVTSCFGGLAIYKKEMFEGCIYDSLEEDCEHVYLHKCMIKTHNAKITLNPAQIIRYEHYSYLLYWLYIAVDKIRYFSNNFFFG